MSKTFDNSMLKAVDYGMINDLKNWSLTLCDNLGPINIYMIEFTPIKKHESFSFLFSQPAQLIFIKQAIKLA
ncbi:hypothetical protein BpHYR1_030296 [Brachionus plicatilis]|uniref:Uncharacterized protein n=1 Tax=Brachionus plicatilis TaxID=10195 RepID=A0A3M7PN98_BRAPC|nr:hypothetical protein BpHYR1_030296 [Brachionus plicatilis]